VHRAAFTFAIAGFLAVEFGHHAIEPGALGDDVAVAAVGAGNVVPVTEVGTDTCRHGFLADGHV
jgi:hypothetical protein